MPKIIEIGALTAIVAGIDACILLSSQVNTTLSLWPFSVTALVPPLALVFVGLVLGVSLMIVWSAIHRCWVEKDSSENIQNSPPAAIGSNLIFACGLAVAVTVGVLLILAVRLGKAEPVTAALMYTLGWLATIATLRAIQGLAQGDKVSFDSYWGGLGGAQGGWRISSMTTILLLALILLAGTVSVATGNFNSVKVKNKTDAVDSSPEDVTPQTNAANALGGTGK